MKYVEKSFVAEKQILLFPDHFVAVSQNVKSSDAAVVTENGRKILKAGTIYPTNDASAKGVVLNDYDLTETDEANVALVIHGFVKKSALPAAPEAAAITALPMVSFR